jgi:toxin-antitoxin system PIN domain toxin
MKSFLPDINVWIALIYDGHAHHPIARAWFEQLERERLYFCRVTQLGFLRLLTNRQVMGNQVMGQPAAWRIFDRLSTDSRIGFLREPAQVDPIFRLLTQNAQPAPNQWPDAYLAAIAEAAGLRVVTMDHSFDRLTGNAALVLRRS